MLVGIAIVLTGIVIYFFHNKLNWLGNLPGDIKIEWPNFRLYIPVRTQGTIWQEERQDNISISGQAFTSKQQSDTCLSVLYSSLFYWYLILEAVKQVSQHRGVVNLNNEELEGYEFIKLKVTVKRKEYDQ